MRNFGLWLNRNSTRVLACSLLLGLFWQDLAYLIKPFAPASAVLCMLLACTRMDWSGIGGILRRPGRIALIVVWVVVAMPLLAYAMVAPFFPEGAPIVAGIVLNTASPPILAAAAMAMILGVEPVIAMVVAVVATALAPLSVPALAGLLGLGAIKLPAMELLLRLAIVVSIVLGGAWVIKRLAGPERIERHGLLLEGGTVLFIAAFGAGMMAGILPILVEQPKKAALFVILAFVVHIAMQLLGAAILWWRDREHALASALLAGFRNMMMIYVVIADVAHEDVVLFVICAQFPMFLLPLVLRPLFRYLNARTNAPSAAAKEDNPNSG
jgi:hypothetical protein